MQHLIDVINADAYLRSPQEEQAIRSERDWLVKGFAEGINRERLGTTYKPVNTRAVAVRLNSHPIYAKSITEVRTLLDKCNRDGFKWFWICTKTHRVVSGE